MKKRKIMVWLCSTVLSAVMISQCAAAKTLKIKNASEKKIIPYGSEFLLQTNCRFWNLRFTSDDETIAPVSEEGIIKPKSMGKTTVRIRQKGKKNKTLKIKIIVKKPTGYTVSTPSGRIFHYEDRNVGKIKLKAAKGYQVYYTTTGKFKKSQKIRSGKTKILQVTQTMKLKVFAVQNKIKVTNAYLNRSKISDRNYGEYYYYRLAHCGGAYVLPPSSTATGAAAYVVK